VLARRIVIGPLTYGVPSEAYDWRVTGTAASRGSRRIGELAQYEDSYRLGYVRGPEGIVVGLAEQLS
jgi:hypothetical protein